jgi:hypothetical protein
MHLVPLIALLAGAASAGLYVYGLTLTITGVFLLLLAPLPLWLAGLGWGSTAAGLAGAVGAIAVLLLSDPLIGTMYAVVLAIPTAILAHLAVARHKDTDSERWFPANALLGALVMIGLIQALAAGLALSATDAGLVGTVRDNLTLIFGAYVTEDSGEGSGALIDQWDSLVLGAMIAVTMVAQAGTGALAQGLLSAANKAIRPSPAFWALRVGDWTRALMVLLLIAVVTLDATGVAADGASGGFFQFLGMAFVLVLGVGFLLQGLAVMHALTRGMRAQPLVLAGVYFVVLAFQPFGAALFALIGFFDRWGNFRERFGVEDDAGMED